MASTAIFATQASIQFEAALTGYCQPFIRIGQYLLDIV